MNIYRFELKSTAKAAVIWGLLLGAVGFFFIAMYPAFLRDVSVLDSILAAYPPEVMKALGVGADGFASFHGYYSFCILYMVLCGAIEALILGIHVIGKEGARKTSDFLFTKPATRQQILTAKYGAVLTAIVLSNGLYTGITLFASVLYVKELHLQVILLMDLAFFLTQLLFVAMGFCIGCFAKKVKSPVTVGIGLGSFFFALEMISNMYDDLALQLISPLSYLNPSYIASHHEYDPVLFITAILLTIGLMIAGFAKYRSKDIHSA